MNKYIFSVDGNIGSGKSTLLKKSQLKNINQYTVKYLQEPVETWNTITDEFGVSILEKYYQFPRKYSFAFQMMAYITRLSDIRKAYNESDDYTIIITERCLETDYNIFAKMLYESGKMEFVEYSIYCKWFDEFNNEFPISGFIYLRTPPEICSSRIESRKRTGEDSIPLDYLIECDSFHKKWLYSKNCLMLDSSFEVESKIRSFILDSIR